MSNSTVDSNSVTAATNPDGGHSRGGGIVVGDLYEDTQTDSQTELTISSSMVSNNMAPLYSGLITQFSSSVTCSASASEVAGFYSNNSSNPSMDIGAVYIAVLSSFSSQDCDFGEGSNNNGPYDVSIAKPQGGYDDYMYGENETFSCMAGVCSP